MTDQRRIIEPQCHEFTANWNTNAHGLRPWFALDSAVKDGGGSVDAQMNALGDTWDATLYYQESAVKPPSDGETPAGSTVEHETIREFRIRVEAHDDVGERKANFHFRPRWLGMEAEKDDGSTVELPIPEQLANTNTDALNVRISGSNIHFAEYGDLLRAACVAVDVSDHYFKESERHHTSNIQDGARYVRVHTNSSGPIHARTGPLVQLAHVLENDRSGYRKLVQNDTDNHGANLPGFYHTATLGPDRVKEVFPNHALPVELKHYYEKEALARSMSDPLRHPKLEAAYQVSRWDETMRYTSEKIDQLVTELDEWLFATLADAGLDLRAGGKTYFKDAYFEAENALTEANVVTLDLTEVRHEQESVVYKHLAGGMSPVEQETLNTLVTDGGTISPQDIAEQNDRHRDSVYSALQGMNDLVEHQHGSVKLKSTYLSELVADALDEAKKAVGRATSAAAEAVNAEKRGLDENTSAFVAWAERHGANYDELRSRDGGKVDLGTVEGGMSEVRRILREGHDLWESMNRDLVDFRTATVKWKEPVNGSTLKSVDDTSTRYENRYVPEVFRLLR